MIWFKPLWHTHAASAGCLTPVQRRGRNGHDRVWCNSLDKTSPEQAAKTQSEFFPPAQHSEETTSFTPNAGKSESLLFSSTGEQNLTQKKKKNKTSDSTWTTDVRSKFFCKQLFRDRMTHNTHLLWYSCTDLSFVAIQSPKKGQRT